MKDILLVILTAFVIFDLIFIIACLKVNKDDREE